MYNILICNIILSLSAIIIISLKNLFGKFISARCNYYIGFLLIFILIVPMVPKIGILQNICYDNMENITKSPKFFNIDNFESNNKDFYISVNKDYTVSFIIISVMLMRILILKISEIRLRKYTESRIYSEEFNKYCSVLKVNAQLYKSKSINSPISFGIIKKYVIIPDRKLKKKEFEIAVLHELTHHKHNDILINYILCILNAVYWFNPFVYMLIQNIRLGMEIYCDYSVIQQINNNIEYGNIILNFAADNKKYGAADCISGNGKHLRSRINKIIEYGDEYSKKVSRAVMAFFICITILTAICINSFGYAFEYNHINIPAAEIDLDNFFNGAKGTFVLYNQNSNEYMIYNKKLAYKRVSPDSTFKIPLALKGLEENIITANDNKMFWNGAENPFSQWNKNQNLNSAMKYSVNWYFQEIDNKLDKSEIINYLKYIDYGNKNVYGNKDYWLENSLKISPVEQIIFLKGFINNIYNFEEENINTVMKAIKLDNGLYGKTGTGMINGKINSGWFIGIAERGNNKYIFATRLENADGLAARDITVNILKFIIDN